jgi:hypothetical protein
VKLILSRLFFFCSVFAALPFLGFIAAQDLKKIKEFHTGKIENVAVDRLGNFFLVLSNGNIRKYDPDGKVLAELKNGKDPTLIEPWFHPKIFLYDQSNQLCTTFDRNFKNPERQTIDPFVAIQPLLACPTNDNKLLVLDRADFSIKRVNPGSHEVIREFYIDSTKTRLNFVYIKEYQNLIFLLDRNSGILIYSNVGKKVNQLKTDANNFGFFGEELYFLRKDKIVFFDLYTEKTRELDVGEGEFILVTDERILLAKDNGRVTIFEFNRGKLPD